MWILWKRIKDDIEHSSDLISAEEVRPPGIQQNIILPMDKPAPPSGYFAVTTVLTYKCCIRLHNNYTSQSLIIASTANTYLSL